MHLDDRGPCANCAISKDLRHSPIPAWDRTVRWRDELFISEQRFLCTGRPFFVASATRHLRFHSCFASRTLPLPFTFSLSVASFAASSRYNHPIKVHDYVLTTIN